MAAQDNNSAAAAALPRVYYNKKDVTQIYM